MYKMIIVYKVPADKAQFDKWYYESHLEIAKKIPNVQEVRLNKITGGPRGESDLHLITEVVFANQDDFKTAMSSPENMAAGKDAFMNAKEIMSVHFAKEEVLS